MSRLVEIVLRAAHDRRGAFQARFAQYVALPCIADDDGHVEVAHQFNERFLLVHLDRDHGLPEFEQLQNNPIAQLAHAAHDDVIGIETGQSDLPLLPAR